MILKTRTVRDRVWAQLSDSIGQCTRCFSSLIKEHERKVKDAKSLLHSIQECMMPLAPLGKDSDLCSGIPTYPTPFWKKFHHRPRCSVYDFVIIYADDLSLRLARPCWKLLLARRGTVLRYLMRPVPVVCLLLAFSPQLTVVIPASAMVRWICVHRGSLIFDGMGSGGSS